MTDSTHQLPETDAFGRLRPVPAASRPDLLAAPVAAALGPVPDALVVEIDASLADTAAFCEAYGVPLEKSVNAVVVKGARAGVERFVVCMTPATKRVDVNKVVRKKLDVRSASFAPMDEAIALTGMEYGGITPVGVPADWPVWIDADAVALDWVCIGGGVRGSKLFLPGRALADLPGAEVVEGLAR